VAPPEPPKLDRLSGAKAAPLALGFRPNSAVLTPDDVAALKGLAHQRGPHKVEAIGFGDAGDATPQVQAEGLDLALARARAIAAALTLAGVPADAIRMNAEASGRGGAARLID
jgi:outer membrane protein OmpA-like peptidoglycan-associated protein